MSGQHRRNACWNSLRASSTSTVFCFVLPPSSQKKINSIFACCFDNVNIERLERLLSPSKTIHAEQQKNSHSQKVFFSFFNACCYALSFGLIQKEKSKMQFDWHFQANEKTNWNGTFTKTKWWRSEWNMKHIERLKIYLKNVLIFNDKCVIMWWNAIHWLLAKDIER